MGVYSIEFALTDVACISEKLIEVEGSVSILPLYYYGAMNCGEVNILCARTEEFEYVVEFNIGLFVK